MVAAQYQYHFVRIFKNKKLQVFINQLFITELEAMPPVFFPLGSSSNPVRHLPKYTWNVAVEYLLNLMGVPTSYNKIKSFIPKILKKHFYCTHRSRITTELTEGKAKVVAVG